MAVLYTPEERDQVLKELRIKAVHGVVSTEEAARILAWRTKAEFKIDRAYTVSAVRRHVQTGNLTPVGEESSTRFNRYRIEDIFDLPLSPNRGKRKRTEVSEQEEKEVA